MPRVSSSIAFPYIFFHPLQILMDPPRFPLHVLPSLTDPYGSPQLSPTCSSIPYKSLWIPPAFPYIFIHPLQILMYPPRFPLHLLPSLTNPYGSPQLSPTSSSIPYKSSWIPPAFPYVFFHPLQILMDPPSFPLHLLPSLTNPYGFPPAFPYIFFHPLQILMDPPSFPLHLHPSLTNPYGSPQVSPTSSSIPYRSLWIPPGFPYIFFHPLQIFMDPPRFPLCVLPSLTNPYGSPQVSPTSSSIPYKSLWIPPGFPYIFFHPLQILMDPPRFPLNLLRSLTDLYGPPQVSPTSSSIPYRSLWIPPGFPYVFFHPSQIFMDPPSFPLHLLPPLTNPYGSPQLSPTCSSIPYRSLWIPPGFSYVFFHPLQILMDPPSFPLHLLPPLTNPYGPPQLSPTSSSIPYKSLWIPPAFPYIFFHPLQILMDPPRFPLHLLPSLTNPYGSPQVSPTSSSIPYRSLWTPPVVPRDPN
ncbi:uncharacterized protein LOC125687831 isoform X6 [Lagopus muta]|uniref:uncharacterized protein LOC125687831 isoform X6 n=1 Tax=Lagopus muta TaxID=64668 RepID=UPI00209FD0B3|nr:uncharacterized protein LOC125687831 isoform X6 [Lagopus muta]